MQTFITGGSGFVGRRLIEMLVAKGDRVRALARTDASANTVRQLGAEPVQGDLHDEAVLRSGMQGCETVHHVAGHLKMWDTYEAFHHANVDGTRAVLAAARAAGVRRLVQIGASAVIMDRPAPIVGADEGALPLAFPAWGPYIKTKAEAEQLVRAANSATLATSVLRPPLIWGVGNPLVAQTVELVRAGKFGWINHGDYALSAAHVDNVCHAAQLAAERAPGGSVYFVTDGVDYQFKDFFTRLLATQGVTKPIKTSYPFALAWGLSPAIEWVWKTLRLKSDPPLTRQMARMIGQPFTLSIARARRELGYEPVVDLAEGMRRLAAAHATQTKPLVT